MSIELIVKQVPQIATDKSDTVPRVNGKKSGWGKITYMNGDWYEGTFVEDKRNGHGVFYYADGNCQKMYFINGVRKFNCCVM